MKTVEVSGLTRISLLGMPILGFFFFFFWVIFRDSCYLTCTSLSKKCVLFLIIWMNWTFKIQIIYMQTPYIISVVAFAAEAGVLHSQELFFGGSSEIFEANLARQKLRNYHKSPPHSSPLGFFQQLVYSRACRKLTPASCQPWAGLWLQACPVRRLHPFVNLGGLRGQLRSYTVKPPRLDPHSASSTYHLLPLQSAATSDT